MKKNVLTLILVVCLFSNVQANLLLNGGFEEGDLGQLGSVTIPGWTYWGTDGWHHDDAGYKFDDKGLVVWWDSVGMYQDVFNVTVGQEYTFSMNAISPTADPLKGWDLVVKAEWLDAGWSKIGETEIGRFVGSKSATDAGDGAEIWKEISGTSTAVEGAAHGRMFFQLVQAGDWGWTGGKVYIDNASVVVPEPATLVLLGLGGALLRKRKK